MAQDQLINEIVGKEAFDQMDRLINKLIEATRCLEDFIKKGKLAESETAGAKGFQATAEKVEDLNKACNDSSKGLDNFRATFKTTEEALKTYNGTIEQNAKQLVNYRSRLAELKEEKKLLDAQYLNKSLDSYKEKLSTLNQEEQKLKLAVSEITSTIKAQIKETLAADGSMAQMAQRLGQLRMAYRSLSEEERNSATGHMLLTEIQTMDSSIKSLDGSLGNHQRNVGNYTKAMGEAAESGTKFNFSIKAVWSSIRQLAYVLPGIGIAGIFALAYEAASKLNEKLMGLDSIESKLIENNKKVAGSLSEEAEALTIMKERFENVHASMDTRKGIVTELNNKYGEQYGAITSISDAEKFFTDKTPDIVKALSLRAQANAELSNIMDAQKRISERESDPESTINWFDKIGIATKSIAENVFDTSKTMSEGFSKVKESYDWNKVVAATHQLNVENSKDNKLIEEAKKSMKELLDLAEKLDKTKPQKLDKTKPQKTDKTPKDKTEQIAESDSRKLAEELLANMNDITLKQGKMTDDYIADLTKQLEAGSITIKEFEDKKAQAVKDSSAKILQSQIDSLNEYLACYALQPDEKKKIQEKIQDLTIKCNAQIVDSEEKTARQIASLREKGEKAKDDALVGEFEKYQSSQRKKEDLEKQAAKKTLELAKQLGNEVLDLFKNSIDAQFQSRIDAIEHEKSLVDDKYNKELDLINATMVAGTDKENAVKKLQAETAAQKEILNQKERQEKIKMAQFDKEMAIARIIEATSISAMDAWHKYLPPMDAITSALILSIGAVQLAKVMATPLPQFASGTPSSPEGLAIVGERGTEGRINPDGSIEQTPSKSTLTYLKRGTQIIPHHEWLQFAGQVSNRNFVLHKSEKIIDTSSINKAIERQTNKLVNTLSGINQKTYINIHGEFGSYINKRIGKL